MADYATIAVIGLFLLTFAVTSTTIHWIRAKRQGITMDEHFDRLKEKM